MKTRRKLGWALIAVGLLATGLALAPHGDTFDALGPPLAPEVLGTHWRTWTLSGTEAESRRRVEALLVEEGGWYLVRRATYPNLNTRPDVSIQYFNDATKDDCELWITHPLRGGERTRVQLDRMTLWRLWTNRLGFRPAATRA